MSINPKLCCIYSQLRGLLLLVSNADYAARRANSRVFSAYASAGYSNVADLKSRVLNSWKAETEALVQRYTRIRIAWLCSPLDKEVTPDTSKQLYFPCFLCSGYLTFCVVLPTSRLAECYNHFAVQPLSRTLGVGPPTGRCTRSTWVCYGRYRSALVPPHSTHHEDGCCRTLRQHSTKIGVSPASRFRCLGKVSKTLFVRYHAHGADVTTSVGSAILDKIKNSHSSPGLT